MSDLKYPISIRPLSSKEGGGYLAEFPDLPGCMADGKTVEGALHEAEDALQAWLAVAKGFGDPIPAPSAITQYSGQWRIRLPKSLHAALALRAKSEGVSLNMLAATLLAQCMGQKMKNRHRAKQKRVN
ncbi:MAG: type II toxin-antitoxin system HicB family antitoxin [Gammaproteobacteria bacterium]